jgi:ligand-binding sensor domain-containing protein/signal transduction histidine kinase/ActR/RegA family two-component response regulator
MRKASQISIFFCLWLLCVSFTGFAQHYNFKNYSLEEGLSHSQILSLLLDSKGYLWIGTNGDGLNRYDGKTFTNYTTKDGLSDNVIYTIFEDREGNLWFGTDDGINKYDGKSFTFYSEKHGLSNNYVSSISEDDKGRLWIGTYLGGVNVFDGTGFTHYTTKQGLSHDNVNSIMRDRVGRFWFATDNGATKYDGTTFTRYTVDDGLIHNTVKFILQDSKEDLWFATDKGVSRFNGIRFFSYTTRDGLCGDKINSIMEDSKGDLWFAAQKGVCHLNASGFTTYTQKQGLPHDMVTSILEDREGNLWFGTSAGISKFNGKMFIFISTKDGLKDNVVWSIWQDKTGTIWFSTENGIGKYNEKNNSLVVSYKGLQGGIAYPFYEDSKGNLWFGTGKNIIKYNGQAYIDLGKQFDIIRDLEIFSIMEDRNGNLWFGTSGEGVLKYDGKSIKQLSKEDGLIDYAIYAMLEDRDGKLWFGTSDGISIYDGKQFTNIRPGSKLNNRYLMAILEDPEGDIWLGTYGGGVTRYPSFETFTINDGLINNEVQSMIFDDNGMLWIGTNKGITALDTAAFKKTGEKRFRNYGKEEGFVGIECNQSAAFKHSSGCLWFGTIRGAIRYDPREDKINTVEPITHITGLKLFREGVDLAAYSGSHPRGSFLPADLKLPHTKDHLTFEFIGISLTVPERVCYRYILEGFDKSWSPVTSSPQATYSNLPHGNYTFKVKACNNSGIWNQIPAAYPFTITAPFWKQWWFHVLCVIAGAMGIYTFIKIRTRSLEKQQRFLEEQVQQRTLELEDEKAKVEQINQELEQRVQERTERLMEAHQKLLRAQKMEVIGTLASGVAHDLNNILAGIVTFPELLLMKMPKDNPFRKHIKTIQKSGEKAAIIVQDMLTMARRGVKAQEVMSLNHLISEVMKSPEMGKLKFYHPEVEIETALEENLPNIAGSPVHLCKTFMNLVSNAAEAILNGGNIHISTGKQLLKKDQPLSGYSEVKPGCYVVLTVSDTGTGISEEDIERIFEPFYTKKKMGRSGTGLGMTVVWSTVQDLNGYITVRSQKNSGTSFSLYFPATRGKPKKKKPKLSVNYYIGQGESILVVDDVKEQRQVLALMLEELNYSVKTVASGEEAVDYVSQQPVDLIMLDMIMEPGIDGLETYKRILKLHPEQKAIIISGFTETEQVREAQRLGAGIYVKKPFVTENIGMAIKNELKREK